MVAHVGKVVGHHHRLARVGEPRLDAVEPEDAVHLGDEEVAVAHRHAVRHEQVLGEGVEFVGLAVTVVVAQRIDAAGGFPGPDEDRPVLTPGQRAGAGQPAPDGDLESRRQREPLQRERGRPALGLGDGVVRGAGTGPGASGAGEREQAEAHRREPRGGPGWGDQLPASIFLGIASTSIPSAFWSARLALPSSEPS